jgi:hypothetical protein
MENPFAIYVFKPGSLGSMTMGYTLESSQKYIQAADLATADFVIAPADILTYDWPRQTLTLDPAIRKNHQVSETMFLKPFSGFIIVYQGQKVLGGVALERISPAAVKYPVMYVMEGPLYPPSDDFKIALRATHDYKVDLEAPTAALYADSAVAEQIRQYFQDLGKLKE